MQRPNVQDHVAVLVRGAVLSAPSNLFFGEGMARLGPVHRALGPAPTCNCRAAIDVRICTEPFVVVVLSSNRNLAFIASLCRAAAQRPVLAVACMCSSLLRTRVLWYPALMWPADCPAPGRARLCCRRAAGERGALLGRSRLPLLHWLCFDGQSIIARFTARLWRVCHRLLWPAVSGSCQDPPRRLGRVCIAPHWRHALDQVRGIQHFNPIGHLGAWQLHQAEALFGVLQWQ